MKTDWLASYETVLILDQVHVYILTLLTENIFWYAEFVIEYELYAYTCTYLHYSEIYNAYMLAA